MTGKVRPNSLWEGKTKPAKKLLYLKSISYIFQALFFKLSQSNLSIITKKRYFGLEKNFKPKSFFSKKRILFFNIYKKYTFLNY